MFRAYDAGRERLVAVKLFKLDLPPERVHQLVAAFEQLIAAELTHPSMAVPLATGITDVSAYLAQDYVAAESLDLAVREYGPAPTADALRVAAQLAGALDFAAVVNVAHGALHPRDILLSADETRMTGIGVARALESIGIVAPVRRPYTAPERMGGGEWDRRADVFSLAALIHELLWGRRVTGSADHIAESLTALPDANLDALQTVFARALADDPKARYESALDFVEALKGAFPKVTIAEPSTRKKQARREIEPKLPLDGPEPEAEREHEAAIVPAIAPRADVSEAPAGDFDLETLDLRAGREARFEQVESAPATIAPRDIQDARDPGEPEDPGGPGGPGGVVPMRHGEPAEAPIDALGERPPISMIEQSRSAVWPLVASLLIGLALGFAGGYGVGTRERPVVTLATGTTPGGETKSAPPSRDATEVAIPKTPIVTASPQTPAVAPSTTARPAPPPTSTAPSRAESPNPAARPAARPAPPARRAPAPAAAASTATTGGFSGRLDVDSRPTGARVFLDGRLVGTTPLSMPAISVGEHAVRLERDGYRQWSSSVKIVAAEQNRVTASLER